AAARPFASIAGVGEEHLHGARFALLAAGEERLAVLVEREAVREDRRHVDAAALHEVEVDLHRVRAPALELLDAERVRADARDLLEVERRPLEALRRLDAGDDDRAARVGDAHAHLDRLGEADRVVDDVDAAAIEPRHAVPRLQHLRAGLLAYLL